MPVVAGGVELPGDLRAFYEPCGGLELGSGIGIVAPDRFLPINEVVLGEQYDDDPSASWCLVAEADESDTAERFSIDLGAGRRGRVYDSFWDRHGVAGSMDVVADSYTSFLARLAAEGLSWTAEGFALLGDAYD
jgi:hypothetical protein